MQGGFVEINLCRGGRILVRTFLLKEKVVFTGLLI